jgi:hypothetical protein
MGSVTQFYTLTRLEASYPHPHLHIQLTLQWGSQTASTPISATRKGLPIGACVSCRKQPADGTHPRGRKKGKPFVTCSECRAKGNDSARHFIALVKAEVAEATQAAVTTLQQPFCEVWDAAVQQPGLGLGAWGCGSTKAWYRCAVPPATWHSTSEHTCPAQLAIGMGVHNTLKGPHPLHLLCNPPRAAPSLRADGGGRWRGHDVPGGRHACWRRDALVRGRGGHQQGQLPGALSAGLSWRLPDRSPCAACTAARANLDAKAWWACAVALA